jgi:hypothetical protein
MPQSSRTFRIFVSSTFSDLKMERNALQKYVFPRLRDLAMTYNCHFQAIDLRWGVSEEASRDQLAIKICLNEIKRCQDVSPRPNFIILLGDRFGWRPLPDAIQANEYESLLPFLSTEERSILEGGLGQLEEASSKGWYLRDDNALPAEYVLQPRIKGSKYEAYETWKCEIEKPLGNALERAAHKAGLSEHELEKYIYSATGREIINGAMKVKDAHEHVFGFFREISNPEAINDSSKGELFYEPDPELRKRLRLLKEQLEVQFKIDIVKFPVEWQGKKLSTNHIGCLPETLADCLKIKSDPHNLCEAVWLKLSKVILSEVKKLEPEEEQDTHIRFGLKRAEFFEGRDEILKQIADYLKNNDSHPLIVFGSSGSGKSAVIAKALQQLQMKKEGNLGLVVRFIGATPGSSDGRTLLESLCVEISRIYNVEEKEIPHEYSRLLQEFPKCLRLATLSAS